MQSPNLFAKGNSVQHNDSLMTIRKYLPLIKWSQTEVETVVDVGIGTGNVTWEILRSLLPPRVRLFGVDKNLKMLEYVGEKYPELKTFLLDITTMNLPQQYRGVFDHVFSFYCLHWVVDLRQALQNVFDMLKPGGSFFTHYLGSHAFRDIFLKLSLTRKWKKYLPVIKEVFNLHQFEEYFQEDLENIIESIGFRVSICKVESKYNVCPDLERLKVDIEAVCPGYLKIPDNLKEEFIKDCLDELFKHKTVQKITQEYPDKIVVPYRHIIILATKPI